MHNAIFNELAVLLAAVAFVTAAFRKLGLNPIIGLFAAGVVLGPQGFAVLKPEGSVAFLSELGIMFLLFIVGLELSADRIRIMAKTIFGLGTAHFALSAALLTGCLWLFLDGRLGVAAALGVALAMSSTAFVLQLLSERRQMSSAFGRQTFSVLLFQDIMVAPLIAVLPLFALNPKAAEHIVEMPSIGLLVAAIAMILVFMLAKLLLEETLAAVRGPGQQDAFPAAVVLIAIVMGWIAHKLGMSASLGAFMAGLALSGASWRHEIKTVIQPFEATLLAFFFIGVGMMIPISGTPIELLKIVGVALAIVAVKFLAGLLAGLLNRLGWRNAVRSSALLAQGGEFSFVLIGIMGSLGMIGSEKPAFWIGAAVISMVVTPLLAGLACQLVAARDEPCETPDEPSPASAPSLKGPAS